MKKQKLKVIEINKPSEEDAKKKIEEISRSITNIYSMKLERKIYEKEKIKKMG